MVPGSRWPDCGHQGTRRRRCSPCPIAIVAGRAPPRPKIARGGRPRSSASLRRALALGSACDWPACAGRTPPRDVRLLRPDTRPVVDSWRCSCRRRRRPRGGGVAARCAAWACPLARGEEPAAVWPLSPCRRHPLRRPAAAGVPERPRFQPADASRVQGPGRRLDFVRPVPGATRGRAHGATRDHGPGRPGGRGRARRRGDRAAAVVFSPRALCLSSPRRPPGHALPDPALPAAAACAALALRTIRPAHARRPWPVSCSRARPWARRWWSVSS